MRRALLLIGKGLIVSSFLWPIPFGLIMNPLFGYDPYDYWWPLLGVMLLGFLLCVTSRFRPKSLKEERIGFTSSLFGLLCKVIIWRLLIIGGFFLLMWFIIGLYYVFISKYMPILLPICVGVGVVGYLFYIGWKVYKNNK